jgi:glycosyltransferase involved in cell wall biosynthesis
VRLLFVTQKLDADDPVLAQTVDLVRELAVRVDGVDVLCDAVGRHDLPDTVRVRTFGASTRIGRGLRFLRGLAAAMRRRPDAVFVHMVPLFVLLAAPLAKPRRVPLFLWYTHWHASRALRASLPLLDAALSVSEESFPLETPKLLATGHAIDTTAFAPRPREPRGRLRLLALGRTARWKGYDTMLAALELATGRGVDAELEIRGPQLTPDERAFRDELAATVSGSPALRDRVRIEPPLPRDRLPDLLAGADALLSATQSGETVTLDKVVYEAAACAVPVLASNDALAGFLDGLPLDLRFPPRDAPRLAELVEALAAADPDVRAEVGAALRQRVVEQHSVDAWADAVVAAVARKSRQ